MVVCMYIYVYTLILDRMCGLRIQAKSNFEIFFFFYKLRVIITKRDLIVIRTIVQTALSSVISDIQSASIAQWLESRLSKPAVMGSSISGGGHVSAILRSSYLLANNGYARHEFIKTELHVRYNY